MQLLVDTNILIGLEDYKEIAESFAKFYQLAIANNHSVFYHPECLTDIDRDNDEERKRIILSKLRKYSAMEHPAEITDDFTLKVGQNGENDRIDNTQLYQISKGYADFFITNDKRIKSRAAKVALQNKILNIEEAKALLSNMHSLVIPAHPLILHLSVRQIENELSSPFFDSLRETYNGFNEWFINKCAKQNRNCYVVRSEEKIVALLIYHKESAVSHQLPAVYSDAVKMCTLKVDETAFGYKLGELFLGKMIEYCIRNSIQCLYLTVFPQHKHLIDLLTFYGFKKSEYENSDKKVELRMIKSLAKAESEPNNTSQFHPFYCDLKEFNKYVIPIAPKFYRNLFTDGTFRQKSLFDDGLSDYIAIEGNTISKAYLCKSKSLQMKKGDILLFYGSREIGAIEPLGILDNVIYTKDVREIKELVKRRTVYSDGEIEQMVKAKKDVTVLLFRHIYYLPKPIKKDIKHLSSYANKFQTITLLQEEDYQNLKQKNYFDERYIIN